MYARAEAASPRCARYANARTRMVAALSATPRFRPPRSHADGAVALYEDVARLDVLMHQPHLIIYRSKLLFNYINNYYIIHYYYIHYFIVV